MPGNLIRNNINGFGQCSCSYKSRNKSAVLKRKLAPHADGNSYFQPTTCAHECDNFSFSPRWDGINCVCPNNVVATIKQHGIGYNHCRCVESGNVKGTCICDDYNKRVGNDGICECKPHFVTINGSCRCLDGAQSDFNRCVCPIDHQFHYKDTGGCFFEGSSVWNGSRCVGKESHLLGVHHSDYSATPLEYCSRRDQWTVDIIGEIPHPYYYCTGGRKSALMKRILSEGVKISQSPRLYVGGGGYTCACLDGEIWNGNMCVCDPERHMR